ncbi:MAG: uracil-DNA glycosylase [Sneathiella sp.]|nr:uracil-DNA glycosylase [Sneathiella sp.]
MTENLKTVLDFYAEAGIDEVIGDSPVNRFELPAVSTPQRRSPLQRSATSHVAQKPTVNQAINTTLSDVSALVNQCSSIDQLHKALSGFDGCSLKKLATKTVFALGNPDADLMVIDRPPSSEGDRSGMPFAGPAGQLLTKMLASIGLKEGDFYASSLIPWRPPGGRAPTNEEQMICMPFIKRHIELANPKIILLCGEAAAPLLEKKSGINRLRGQWAQMTFGKKTIPAIPIFHPSFLMDHPASKKLAWADLLELKAALV